MMPPTFRLRITSVQNHLANWSLRAKVTLGVVVPMIAVLSLFTFLQYRRHRAYLLANLSLFASYSAEVVETNLRHQMLEADLSGVETLIHTVGAREEFEALHILDMHPMSVPE